jgi:ABC-type bacteriocin/lantibiotic exporter with double-glycine peptidase domain
MHLLSSVITEDINGMETIKSLASEEECYQKIDREFVRFLRKSFAFTKISILQEGLKQGIHLVLNVFILWFGSTLVMKGKISLGQLITYNVLLSYFVNTLESIVCLQSKL